MATAQGPNVTDPDARAILAAAGATTIALDYLLCSVRDGEEPERGEIANALADALNHLFSRYPAGDAEEHGLHVAACDFLGIERPTAR